jgi:cytosine deaminase
MTSQSAMRQCFDAVTVNPARILGLQGYGLEVGCDASFVLLQARDPVEAIRLRANRLKVWKKGTLIAETAPIVPKLHLPGRPNAQA